MELLQRNLFLVTCIVLILDPHADGGGGPSKRSRKGESVCSASCVNRTADARVCVCVRARVTAQKSVEKWRYIYIYEFRDPDYSLYYFALRKYTCDLSVVDMVTELRDGRSGFRIPIEAKDCLFFKMSTLVLGGPPNLPFGGYRGFSRR